MDWFESLVGFRETTWKRTRALLYMEDEALVSRVNGARWRAGRLETPSLAELRAAAPFVEAKEKRLRVSLTQGDAGVLHELPDFSGALFQVASQFNLLEMVEPGVTPEDGVTGYRNDRTQGPACALAAGAATIYRNYFVSCGAGARAGSGQTATRQIDALADLGEALGRRLGVPPRALWEMRNGYCLSSDENLAPLASNLRAASPGEIDALRGALRIGVHWDVEVTRAQGPDRPLVSQAFCSALPIAYCRARRDNWEPLARLVLEGAYEATLRAAALNARRGASKSVLLTQLGGGAFGNPEGWILDAMKRALDAARGEPLDVRLVSYDHPSEGLRALARAFA